MSYLGEPQIHGPADPSDALRRTGGVPMPPLPRPRTTILTLRACKVYSYSLGGLYTIFRFLIGAHLNFFTYIEIANMAERMMTA